jgi:DUF4097 and DUF4098 domain-containing protein YvlB
MFARTSYSGALVLILTFMAAPAFADFKFDRQLALAPGGMFILETDIGSIALTGDSTSGAQVNLTSSDDDFQRYFDVQVDEQAGTARVTVKRRSGIVSSIVSRFWSLGRVRFTVHVPRATTVILSTSGGSVDASQLGGSARLRTSGGGVRVENIAAEADLKTSGGAVVARAVRGNVKANTSGGGITIENVGGAVRAETSGGGIEIATVGGEVYADTSGGGVRIKDAGGRVEAHTSGGPVSVRFAAGNGQGGTVSTSGGGVVVEVDPSVALSIDASTSGGSVRSDVPVTTQGKLSNNALNGSMNGGGPLLQLRSSGGGIRIVPVK